MTVSVRKAFAICAFGALFALALLAAQVTASSQPGSRVIGEITAVDPSSGQVSVRSDKGDAITLVLRSNVSLRKVRAGTTDLTQALPIPFADLGVGDRILASVQPTGDNHRFEARSVIIMSRSDVAEKQRSEREDWQKRGIFGTVAAIHPDKGTLTVKTGETATTIQVSPRADVLRYAPNSVRFADARKSSLSDIQPGDLIRILGNRAPEGTSVSAERIVFGTFVQLAGTIDAINADTGEVVVKDLKSKKMISLTLNANSAIKRLQTDAAGELARLYRNSGQNEPGGPGAGRNRPHITHILEQLPSLPVSDLKTGEAVMLSMTAAPGVQRPLAIIVLAGVEPLLTASPAAARDILGSWNLGTAGENQ